MALYYIVYYRNIKEKKEFIKDGKITINVNGGAIVFSVIIALLMIIVLIGIYIYESSNAVLMDSMTSMSTSEIEDSAVDDWDVDFSDISSTSITNGASDSTGTASTGLFSSKSDGSKSKLREMQESSIDYFSEPMEDSEVDVAETDYDLDEEVVTEEEAPTTSITDEIGNVDTEKVEKVRNVFLESLAFVPNIVTQNGKANQEITLSDNITTWNIQAVGNTREGNIGYTSSNFKVFKDFFVNYTLPTNAVVTDKVKIPVTVYNYTEAEMTVNINVVTNDWSTIGDYTHDVAVTPKGTTMIYVPLEITKDGNNTLRIESKGPSVSDIVEKSMTVKPNGVQTEEVVTNGIIKDKYYQDVIFDEAALDNTKKLKVKIYPAEINIVVENIESILAMPTGCFEQTSSSLYPDILVLKYLKDKNLDDENLRTKAEEYICSGYQRLLTYEVQGTKGGYSLYGNSPAEPVITAFGLMEMKEASEVYPVDENVIKNMEDYLFGVQKSNGSFNIGSTYIGDSARTTDLAMNAYIIWALSEACPEDTRINKSIEYLEENMNTTSDSYTLALIANVFSNTKNKNTDKVLEKLLKNVSVDNNTKCFESSTYDYYGTRGKYQNIQATALTVMALVKENKEKTLCEELVEYIVNNRDYRGAWGTTQATILALKAVNVASTKSNIKNQTLKIKVNDDQKEIEVKDNSLSVYELEFTNVKDENKVEIDSAKGKVSYEIIKDYYETYENALSKNGDKLTISQVITPTTGIVNDEITQTITINNNSEMIKNGLVKVHIPQGSSVIEESLAKLKAEGRIEKYEYNYNTINIYLRNFDKGDTSTLEIKYRANYPVDITGGMAKVYDYYNPEISAITAPEHIVITE